MVSLWEERCLPEEEVFDSTVPAQLGIEGPLDASDLNSRNLEIAKKESIAVCLYMEIVRSSVMDLA